MSIENGDVKGGSQDNKCLWEEGVDKKSEREREREKWITRQKKSNTFEKKGLLKYNRCSMS